MTNSNSHYIEDSAAWCSLNSLDCLLVEAVYDLAHQRGYDTEPPDRPMLSRVWQIRVFCSDSEFSDLINAAQGVRLCRLSERVVVPERIGATP